MPIQKVNQEQIDLLRPFMSSSAAPAGHASSHITGGGDEIDGDRLDIDWNPSNYTPDTTPAEADDVDHLTSHLYGIDQVIAGLATTSHASTHITGGSDEVDGDKLDIDWDPTNYTPATTPAEADNVDNLTAHLYGIDQALSGKSDTGHDHDADYADIDHDATHITGGSDEIDGDRLDIDWSPASYTPDSSPAEAGNVDHLTAHLKGIDDEISAIYDSTASITHASTHITGGSDEVDGDKLDIDWNPSNYTPATTPAEADSIDNLTAHLYGLDQALVVATHLLFSLNKNASDQSVSSSTWTKVTWSTASWDHDSGFDNANDRFTPNTGGYWHFHAIVKLNALVDGTTGQIVIRKNGTAVVTRALAAGAVVSLSLDISCILEANGSTDYFEIWVHQDSGISRDIEGDTDCSIFEGTWLRES